jgi:High potential iron-sulfur protein
MQRKITRRAVVRGGLMVGALMPALGLIGQTASAATLPPLDTADPTAKAFGFVNDSSKVDAAANPTHKPDQKCSNCAQFQGKAGDARGGCNIFAGKSVPADAWCRVWTKKP